MTPLAQRAARHVVTPSAALQAYLVTSGSSGHTYTVVPGAGGAAKCNCAFGTHRPGADCSHTLAVRAFAQRVLGK